MSETENSNQKPKLSKLAVASLLVGMFAVLLSFLSFEAYRFIEADHVVLIFFGLSIIFAPVLGITALVQIALSKGSLRGNLLAIFGICASPISIVSFFFLWITCYFTLPA